MTFLFFLWTTTFLLFFVIEFIFARLLLFLSCAIGAIFAALSSLYFFALGVQVTIFIGSGFLFFGFMHFLCNPGDYARRTTYLDIVLGRKGLVIKNIIPGSFGQVKIGEVVWSARSLNHEIIIEGTSIEVVGVQERHLLIKVDDNGETVSP